MIWQIAFEKKHISIFAGNLNSGRSYLIMYIGSYFSIAQNVLKKKKIIGQNVRFFIVNQINLSKMQNLFPCKN